MNMPWHKPQVVKYTPYVCVLMHISRLAYSRVLLDFQMCSDSRKDAMILILGLTAGE